MSDLVNATEAAAMLGMSRHGFLCGRVKLGLTVAGRDPRRHSPLFELADVQRVADERAAARQAQDELADRAAKLTDEPDENQARSKQKKVERRVTLNARERAVIFAAHKAKTLGPESPWRGVDEMPDSYRAAYFARKKPKQTKKIKRDAVAA